MSMLDLTLRGPIPPPWESLSHVGLLGPCLGPLWTHWICVRPHLGPLDPGSRPTKPMHPGQFTGPLAWPHTRLAVCFICFIDCLIRVVYVLYMLFCSMGSAHIGQAHGPRPCGNLYSRTVG